DVEDLRPADAHLLHRFQVRGDPLAGDVVVDPVPPGVRPGGGGRVREPFGQRVPLRGGGGVDRGGSQDQDRAGGQSADGSHYVLLAPLFRLHATFSYRHWGGRSRTGEATSGVRWPSTP